MESDIKEVKHELAKLKTVAEKDLKNREDHILAEVEDMKATYDKVMTE